ncbi:MAG: glycoside hydrolase family 97 C-terminal domain-containing protein [Chitinophagaceae bacterium]
MCIARKAKGKDDWFVGAITDENVRNMTVKFNFLDKNTSYLLTLYADSKTADYINNPQSYEIKKYVVNSQSKLSQRMARSGGFAIRIEKMDKQNLQIKNSLNYNQYKNTIQVLYKVIEIYLFS